MRKLLSIDKIEAFIFDFDGVLTNNKVQLDQSGKEWVTCSRADGLAFDALYLLKKPVFIMSTETNPVVSARGKKLNVDVIQGVSDKVMAIKDLVKLKKFHLENIFFVGNDLNDYFAMKICGYSACPVDSHPKVKDISKNILNSEGGNGVIRELLEETLNLDLIKILYQDRGVKK